MSAIRVLTLDDKVHYIKNLYDLFYHSFFKNNIYQFYPDIGHGEPDYTFVIIHSLGLRKDNGELCGVRTRVAMLAEDTNEQNWIWLWGENGPNFYCEL